MRIRLLIAVLVAACLAFPVAAQIKLSPESLTMLKAEQAVMKRDFSGAISLYGQVIASNPNNIEAYLQRGVARREAGNPAGAEGDGAQAVRLANAALQAAPNNANLYHERGMGWRLLHDYRRARADIEQALRLSGNNAWRADLQAVALEEKMNP